MQLILVRGVPGSGKSTFAKNVFSGAFHIENDMFHVKDGKYQFDRSRQKDAVAWCMDMCDTALRNGMDVVVSNTFTKVRYVMAYARLASEHGADLTVYRMNGSFENSHSVPKEVFENMKNNFEGWPGEVVVTPAEDGYGYSDTDEKMPDTAA